MGRRPLNVSYRVVSIRPMETLHKFQRRAVLAGLLEVVDPGWPTPAQLTGLHLPSAERTEWLMWVSQVIIGVIRKRSVLRSMNSSNEAYKS